MRQRVKQIDRAGPESDGFLRRMKRLDRRGMPTGRQHSCDAGRLHGTCGSTGITIPLAGVVPALPLGAPTSVAEGVLTWSMSTENGVDLGFGGLSAEVQSTITVTLNGR